MVMNFSQVYVVRHTAKAHVGQLALQDGDCDCRET